MFVKFVIYSYRLFSALHRTENHLIAERRTSGQLREYINQMEYDLKTQTDLVNELLVVNKETEVKYKMQVCNEFDFLCYIELKGHLTGGRTKSL